MAGIGLPGAAAQSYWHAEEQLAANAKRMQVVEVFETVAAL